MPAENERLIGINEVGSFTGDDPGPYTDTAWGNTTIDGTQLQLAADSAELQSGQAKILEDGVVVTGRATFVFALVVSELTAIRNIYGITTALVGDLANMTPSAEKLTISTTDFGSREESLYIQTPGPASTREIRGFRCRILDMAPLTFASNAWQTPGASWGVFAPQGATPNPPLTLEDLV